MFNVTNIQDDFQGKNFDTYIGSYIDIYEQAIRTD